jgi:hypothetical protein
LIGLYLGLQKVNERYLMTYHNVIELRESLEVYKKIFNCTRMKCNTGGYLSEEIMDKQQ